MLWSGFDWLHNWKHRLKSKEFLQMLQCTCSFQHSARLWFTPLDWSTCGACAVLHIQVQFSRRIWINIFSCWCKEPPRHSLLFWSMHASGVPTSSCFLIFSSIRCVLWNVAWAGKLLFVFHPSVSCIEIHSHYIFFCVECTYIEPGQDVW